MGAVTAEEDLEAAAKNKSHPKHLSKEENAHFGGNSIYFSSVAGQSLQCLDCSPGLAVVGLAAAGSAAGGLAAVGLEALGAVVTVVEAMAEGGLAVVVTAEGGSVEAARVEEDSEAAAMQKTAHQLYVFHSKIKSLVLS